jgi:hypothetical protein
MRIRVMRGENSARDPAARSTRLKMAKLKAIAKAPPSMDASVGGSCKEAAQAPPA